MSPAVERLLAHLDNDVGFATRLVADLLASRDRWLRRTGAAPTRAELEAALFSERQRLTDKAKALYPEASEELARLFLTQKGEWKKKPAAPPQAVAIPGLLEALRELCDAPPAQYERASSWQALEAILALLQSGGRAAESGVRRSAAMRLHRVLPRRPARRSAPPTIRATCCCSSTSRSATSWSTSSRTPRTPSSSSSRSSPPAGARRRAHALPRRRPDAVDLPLPRSRGFAFPDPSTPAWASVALEPLTLRTNFRSQAGLVAWFNDAFARVLPPEEDEAAGAVPYSPASPKHPPLDGAATQLALLLRPRLRGAAGRLASSSPRPGRKAILVRNRAHLDEIVPALKDAGLRFKAVEIEQLGEKQVVQDLYALTRALSHLADRIAWPSPSSAPPGAASPFPTSTCLPALTRRSSPP